MRFLSLRISTVLSGVIGAADTRFAGMKGRGRGRVGQGWISGFRSGLTEGIWWSGRYQIGRWTNKSWSAIKNGRAQVSETPKIESSIAVAGSGLRITGFPAAPDYMRRITGASFGRGKTANRRRPRKSSIFHDALFPERSKLEKFRRRLRESAQINKTI